MFICQFNNLQNRHTEKLDNLPQQNWMVNCHHLTLVQQTPLLSVLKMQQNDTVLTHNELLSVCPHSASQRLLAIPRFKSSSFAFSVAACPLVWNLLPDYMRGVRCQGYARRTSEDVSVCFVLMHTTGF